MNSHRLILRAIEENCASEVNLRALKVKTAGKSGKLLRNSELFAAYVELLRELKIQRNPALEKILKKARIRTLSGVSPVAVLTKEMGCPGKCIFCPTEKGMPKSYLSNEPAVMRAVRAKFDPFLQVRDRLTALTACGHATNKIELIIMGGTFSAHPKQYQNWFIRRCLTALNSHKSRSRSLADLKKANETSRHRLVGLTLETRPDFISENEVRRFLMLGCTRVEFGAQNLSDKILAKVKRNHTTADTVHAIKLLKNAGLKVGLHLMPNLPGATPKSDLEMFHELFTNEDFAPDQLKIYPTVLVENTELKKWWAAKKWQPYSDKTLTELLTEIKKLVPPWVRLSRIIRDIPAESIIAGSKITNLRQVLQQKKVLCHCIRCREIRDEKFDPKKTQLIKREYRASGGKEIFLSFESKDKLIALLRLRFCKKGAFVREIHSYGAELKFGEHEKGSGQHHGFGKKLIKIAEKIAIRQKFRELKIISGVGVRPYYRQLGYRLDRDGIYVVKKLHAK